MASRRDYTPRSSPLAAAADSKTRTGATPSRIVSALPPHPRPLSAALPRSREFGPFPPPAAAAPPRPKSASHLAPPPLGHAHAPPPRPPAQWLTASPGPPPFSRTRTHGVVMPVHASLRRPRTAPAALAPTDPKRARSSGEHAAAAAATAPPKAAGEFGELRAHHHHHHHQRSKTEQRRARPVSANAATLPRHAKSASCLRSVREEDPEEFLEEAAKAAKEDGPPAAVAVSFSLPPADAAAADDVSSVKFLDDLSRASSVKSAATTITTTSTITATSAIWPVLSLDNHHHSSSSNNNNNSKETSNGSAKAWRCRWQRFLRFVHTRNTTKGLEP